jgi:hypothetical protein
MNYRKSKSPENATKIIIVDDFKAVHVCERNEMILSNSKLSYFEFKKLRYLFDSQSGYEK